MLHFLIVIMAKIWGKTMATINLTFIILLSGFCVVKYFLQEDIYLCENCIDLIYDIKGKNSFNSIINFIQEEKNEVRRSAMAKHNVQSFCYFPLKIGKLKIFNLFLIITILKDNYNNDYFDCLTH